MRATVGDLDLCCLCDAFWVLINSVACLVWFFFICILTHCPASHHVLHYMCFKMFSLLLLLSNTWIRLQIQLLLTIFKEDNNHVPWSRVPDWTTTTTVFLFLSHSLTFLQTRFKDDTPQGLNREGHTRGGLQPQKRDGFTMSTGVHSYGPEIDTTETLRRLEPYQSRSVTGGQLPSQQKFSCWPSWILYKLIF